jgi:hypothetical protein
MSVIGKMTKSRGTFGALSGVTKVDKNKKKYTRKQKHKSKDRAGE